MKNRILLILIMCILTPVYGVNYADESNVEPVNIELQAPVQTSLDDSVDEALQNSTKEVTTPHVEDVTVMTPNANEEITKEVLKDTDSNLKFTFKKFLFAMAGVMVSSIIIFAILSIMNKINSLQKGFIKCEEEEDKKEEIVIPGGDMDALKIFLDKTK